MITTVASGASLSVNEVEGVPDFSAHWYRDIVGFAHDLPSWVRDFVGLATQGILVVFGLLFLIALWRSRREGPRAVAMAVLAPVAMVIAYLISESVKSVLREERPCRAVPRIAETVLDCPEVGDWSLPSNHTTLAAAAAVGLVVVWRRCSFFAPHLALLEAFSRVFVGAHYPHDVIGGLLLGSTVAIVIMNVGGKTVAPLVERLFHRSAPKPPSASEALTGPIF